MKTGLDSPGNWALRRGRCSIPCQIYLITFATLDRQAFFQENYQAANAFCNALIHDALWVDAKMIMLGFDAGSCAFTGTTWGAREIVKAHGAFEIQYVSFC